VSQSENRQVAIIEDDPALRQNYQHALEKAGYSVSSYGDAVSALDDCKVELPDLALIDIGLGTDPEGGFELCRQLRAMSTTLPILFLTARDSELDVISGLRLGADDYLIKDISLAHLIARISALFRRNTALLDADQSVSQKALGQLLLDNDRLQVSWNSQPVELTVTEFWLVHSLAEREGQVKSRQQLMDAASVVLDDQTITAHIKRIRRKFQQLDADFSAIQTVYGMGYRWVQTPAE